MQVDCTDVGTPDDVDTPQDLAALADHPDREARPMKLENRFTVPVPVDEAWKVLLDVERIAPCMPGATLDAVDGDDFEGKVKVKVGPINLHLRRQGAVRLEGRGDPRRGHRRQRQGDARHRHGQGAHHLPPHRQGRRRTDVEVDTDLNVTGKPAQFGRGVLADVSGKLVDQFAACLSDEIRSGTPTGAAEAPPWKVR